MRSLTSVVALGILFLIGSGIAECASQQHQESLRGLAGVAIRVERINQDAQLYGLDEMSVYADAEQRLGKAGIKTLTAAQVGQTAGAPVLYIRVNAKQSWDANVFAVNVTVSLLQDVVAARDPNLKLREAKTWDAGYMRTFVPEALSQGKKIVSDLVDEFIQDWKTANAGK